MGFPVDELVVPAGWSMTLLVPVVRHIGFGSTRMALPPLGFDEDLVSSVVLRCESSTESSDATAGDNQPQTHDDVHAMLKNHE